MNAMIQPQNIAERLVWHSILLSYPFYFLGLMFPINTTLPWLLLINVIMRFWQQSDRSPITDRVSLHPIIVVWMIAALTVFVAMLVGLTDFNYDIREIVRSSLNWSREWPLYPICLAAGCCLNIRPQIIYRAVCHLCAQSLVMLAVGLVSAQLHLPALLYNSPIERLTQNGKLFYEVRSYVIDFDSGGLRFTLFTPWPPALGLVACIYFLLVLQESHRGWKTLGVLGSLAMLFASVSRGALLFLPISTLLLWIWVAWNRAYLQFVMAFLCFCLGLFSFKVSQLMEQANNQFVGVRKSSSQLRDLLQRMAIDRWAEAPIWGHGKQTHGPEFLKGMPLGSHHTWVGLLFSHGVVGFVAIFVAMGSTLVLLAIEARVDQLARVAFVIFLVVLFTSFGDSIEKLAYIFWPAIVLIGMVFRPKPLFSG